MSLNSDFKKEDLYGHHFHFINGISTPSPDGLIVNKMKFVHDKQDCLYGDLAAQAEFRNIQSTELQADPEAM